MLESQDGELQPPMVARALDATLHRRIRECEEFFAQPELGDVHPARVEEAVAGLLTAGTYYQTPAEVLLGAKLAWRNHARCVGRSHWRTLKLIDARHVTSAADLAEACWSHLRLSTNGGAVQSTITVGPLPRDDGREWLILNPQLIRYAGYPTAGGQVVGDPATLEITELALRLGWRGAGTAFDVLPLIVSTPDEGVVWFDLPADCVLEVHLSHPDYPWFADLGLRWHALPAVTNMSLEVGGLSYSCAPFSGWYLSAEIGARNLSDTDRYNQLPVIAERLGLDMTSDRTLWKDRALVELNRAVLHSFREAGVLIVDHHTVARQFLAHIDREHEAGRACPTDWTWINPPLSSSTTPTFHRYYDPPAFDRRPNFARRVDPVLGRGAPAPTGCPMDF
ncbi:MAG: nitric oxide synthase oxygenase [Actinopolymorphaceae bacterium]